MLKKSFFGLLAVLFLSLGVASSGHCLAYPAPGGSGDVLFSSLYDVRNLTERAGATWENYITIQNTSNAWVAAHLRFRARAQSLEVWDHIILLSPYDVLWLDLVRKTGGGVSLFSQDTQTLRNSGMIKATETALDGISNPTQAGSSFSIDLLTACGYSSTTALEETEVGYIEVIGLWSIANSSHAITSIAYDSFADSLDPGAVNVYDVLFTIWGNDASPNGRSTGDRATNGLRPASPVITTDSTYSTKMYPLIDCPNVLQASIEMGDIVTGAYQLENFVAIGDFRTTTSAAGIFYHRDLADNTVQYNQVVTAVRNGGVIAFPVAALAKDARTYTTGTTGLYANRAYEVAWYCNPDVSTTVGPTLRDGDSSANYSIASTSTVPSDAGFNSTWSLYDVELALYKTQVWSYYFNTTPSTPTPFNATITTDLVFTFPTKHNHFFYDGWFSSTPPGYLALNWTSYGGAGGATLTRTDKWPFWNGSGRSYTQSGIYTNLLVAERLLVKSKYDAVLGGPIYVNKDLSGIFNTTQDRVTISPVNSPNTYGAPTLPYEVNIVRVGADGLLSTAYAHGQLFIQDWELADDPRWRDTIDHYGFWPELPIIGQSIRQHVMPGSTVHRTASAPLQYNGEVTLFNTLVNHYYTVIPQPPT